MLLSELKDKEEYEKTIHKIDDIFKSFLDFPQNIKPITKKEKREILLIEIHAFYKNEGNQRKVENWKRYCSWLRANRIHEKTLGRDKNLAKFKRTKKYIREISLSSLGWLLRHIPMEDLHYFTSTGREFSHTGKSFGSWMSQWFEKIAR